ncbi:class I SAM-dependent methyltransferase [Streptacidiphilus jiangxiensis]|uniref:Methyltransferase domain-containing protein n=1 Tax=Streptacidiphilus jiangxiensis TaxID=235985 RepID=A0A1H7T6L3_STRJI|nr:methyltransferase domain-containing protein [Streptacidiphilus jiangxiensis]SEL79974.1 Methyltransferase domain-containing protein [Streptacidiphilus jiangxiensis]
MDLTRQFALPSGVGGAFVGALMARRHDAQVRACVTDLAPRAGERLLEIGFGPGTGLLALAASAPDLTLAGVDPSELMLTSARRRTRRAKAPVELRQGTVQALPWADGTFDGVCAVNSVQLWQPRDASLAEVRRVLRPAGRLALSVLEEAVLPDGGSAGPHYDDELLPALAAAGFAELRAEWRATRRSRALHVRAVRSPTA